MIKANETQQWLYVVNYEGDTEFNLHQKYNSFIL